MRHRVVGRKFGRKKGVRRAFLKILLGNFVMHERIVTTEARAKEIRTKAEKLITLAKRHTGDLAGYRMLLKRLPKPAAGKIHKELRERYQHRTGGYVRIIRTGARRMRDSADTVIVELVK